MNKNKYVEIFVREAEEHLQNLRQGFLALEKDGISDEQLNSLLRYVHTLKGSAKMVDLAELAGVAHRMEDMLKALQGGEQTLNSDLIDIFLVATDAIEALIAQANSGGGINVNVDNVVDALNKGKLEEKPEGGELKPSYDGTERRKSVRASVERLDQLTNCMGEILLSHQTLEERHRQMTLLLLQMDDFLGRLQRIENYRDLKGLRDELAALLHDFSQDNLLLGYQAEDIYQRAMELRMLPLSTITDEFERSVRDLARTLKKDVRFTVKGQDVELDRNMLDAIKPILLHVLNNAVDHGIEDSATRLQLGKPKAGQILLEASYEGNFVQIVIRDDGQGMNPQNIRQAAIKRGLLSAEEAAALSDEAAIYLVLEPGFSTREFITDVSGRGVGLDVVKTNLDQVKGNLSLSSRIGAGTELLLRLPLSMAVFTGLLIEAAGQTFVCPEHYVMEVLRISPADIQEEMGREVVRVRERTIPLCSLAQLLELQDQEKLSRRMTVLVLSFREQTLGLLVTKTIGLQDIVVKQFGSQLKSLEFFSGATLLGDGTPALILSTADLFTTQQGFGAPLIRKTHEQKAVTTRSRILVVDDSITTRTMEKNILETHGYEVVTAVSGFDALEKLAQTRFDLMVSDVEMPGMSGFELTKQIRQREELASMPIIIVTSLASDDHRRQGIDVGAQAYIVKGNFEQGVLLDTVATLIA